MLLRRYQMEPQHSETASTNEDRREEERPSHMPHV